MANTYVDWTEYPVARDYVDTMDRLQAAEDSGSRIRLQLKARNLLRRMEAGVKRAAIAEAESRGYETII
jgi:hypothetical protein